MNETDKEKTQEQSISIIQSKKKKYFRLYIGQTSMDRTTFKDCIWWASGSQTCSELSENICLAPILDF
jgi:hypothetical protein